jgi:hypothetical protein
MMHQPPWEGVRQGIATVLSGAGVGLFVGGLGRIDWMAAGWLRAARTRGH